MAGRTRPAISPTRLAARLRSPSLAEPALRFRASRLWSESQLQHQRLALAAGDAGDALTARPLVRPLAKAARLKAWHFLVYPLRPGIRAERLSP